MPTQTLVEPPIILPPKPVSLPADLLEMLNHDNSNVRKIAMQELVSLLDGKHLGLARAAQEKLREIAENDDSLTLRRIASQELSTRGLETSLPYEIEDEKLIRKPSRPPRRLWSPQKNLSALVKRLPLPKLERRLIGGILGVVLGVVLLGGASKFILNIMPISVDTPTATITPSRLATSIPSPSMTITPTVSQTALPTPTQTGTPTPTLSPTPTSTRTLIPPFTKKPTKKGNNNNNNGGPTTKPDPP